MPPSSRGSASYSGSPRASSVRPPTATPPTLWLVDRAEVVLVPAVALVLQAVKTGGHAAGGAVEHGERAVRLDRDAVEGVLDRAGAENASRIELVDHSSGAKRHVTRRETLHVQGD